MPIQSQLKNLPQKPGVYIFRDKDKKILYIGKATSLKNRAGSYFSGAHNYRIEKMISQIEEIKIKETDTVLERRFRNNWTKPNLIFLDGGKGHVAMAEKLSNNLNLKIPIIAVAKGPTRKKLDLYFANCENKKGLLEVINDKNLIA